MIAWLQGDVGPGTQNYYEKLTREFWGFLEEQGSGLVWFIALCGVVLIVVGIKRALAPRARRAKEVAELFQRLVQANGLTAEERKRVEEAAAATRLENPAHIFARPTVWEAATKAVLEARPAEKQRLAAEYEKLKAKIFS